MNSFGNMFHHKASPTNFKLQSDLHDLYRDWKERENCLFIFVHKLIDCSDYSYALGVHAIPNHVGYIENGCDYHFRKTSKDKACMERGYFSSARICQDCYFQMHNNPICNILPPQLSQSIKMLKKINNHASGFCIDW